MYTECIESLSTSLTEMKDQNETKTATTTREKPSFMVAPRSSTEDFTTKVN